MRYNKNNFDQSASRAGIKKFLGTSLDNLLGTNYSSDSNIIANDMKNLEIKQVMLQDLMPGKFQPRKTFGDDELYELADSISMHGVLQPIIVREVSENIYEIIAGERRWRAAKIAEIKQVPVVVSNISDQEALAFGIIENIQRQDLNPIEEAFSIKRLIDEFKLTHAKVSTLLGKSRASISNILRLTHLTKNVQDLLIVKKIEIGHAKILLAFEPEKQQKLALKIIENKMTVRTLEKFIRNNCNMQANTQPELIDDNLEHLKMIMENKFATEVILKLNNKGRGKIIINIKSIQDLENLIKKL